MAGLWRLLKTVVACCSYRQLPEVLDLKKKYQSINITAFYTALTFTKQPEESSKDKKKSHGVDPEGVGGKRGSGHPPPTLENHIAIRFLRNTGNHPFKKPKSKWTPWVQLLLKGGSYGPL